MTADDPQRGTALLSDPYGDGEAVMRPAVHVSVRPVMPADASRVTTSSADS